MLTKTLLFVTVLLLVAKFLFRLRFRELGRRLDRAVNVILVLIVLSYGASLGLWLLRSR